MDYSSTFIPENTVIAPAMHRRQSFQHEREVRLVMLTGHSGPDPAGGVDHVTLDPEGLVLPVDVDLEHVIASVRVAPEAPAWFLDVVENVTRQYGFRFPVTQSDPASDPIS